VLVVLVVLLRPMEPMEATVFSLQLLQQAVVAGVALEIRFKQMALLVVLVAVQVALRLA
jgi:hypothetical protein